MKPLLTLAVLVGLAAPALAESRSVLVVVTHDTAGKAAVTIHSDDQADRRRDVTVAEACKAIAAMRGWGSVVNVYLATDRTLSRADRNALFDAIDGNFILDLEHYGRQPPGNITEHFRASLDELRGTWVVTDDGGENPVRPDGHAKGTRWVFEAGRLTVGDEAKKAEPDRVVRTYTTDPAKSPKTIDVHLGPAARIGPAAFVQHGIYAIDGEQLKLFFAMPSKDRPTAFPPAGGTEQNRVLTLTRQNDVPQAAAPTEVPAHLRDRPSDLYARDGDRIINAPADLLALARTYPALADKGKVVGGRRITIMADKTRCTVGEKVRVVHVLEAVEAGVPVYVMGPKPVTEEYVDGKAGRPREEPGVYDGRLRTGPVADFNYEITEYAFDRPRRHTIQWKGGGHSIEKPLGLTSNVLVIEVGEKSGR